MGQTLSEYFNSETAENILKYFASAKFIITLLTIMSAIALIIAGSKLFRFYLKKRREMNNESLTQEHVTMIHVISSVFTGVVALIAIIFILQINGLQVSSLITSVSIVSAIVGLALQDTIKDIIQGIQILSDKYFQVGDVVKYENFEGVVIKFSMRSTKIRDIRSQNEISIANRNISRIEKQSDKKYIHILLPYEEPVKKIFDLFKEICPKVAGLAEVNTCTFRGLHEMAESGLDYIVEITCDPKFSPRIVRAANAVIMEELNAAGVNVPYRQVDVHVNRKTVKID